MDHNKRLLRRRALAIALATTLSAGSVFAAETTNGRLQPPQNDSAPKWRSVTNARNSPARNSSTGESVAPEIRVADNRRSVPASPWATEAPQRPAARQRSIPTSRGHHTGLPTEAELNARYFSGDAPSVVSQPSRSTSGQSSNLSGSSSRRSERSQSQWQRNDAEPSWRETLQGQPDEAPPSGESGIHLGGPVANNGTSNPQPNSGYPYNVARSVDQRVASRDAEAARLRPGRAEPVDGGWQTLPTSGVAFREAQLQRSNPYSAEVPENYGSSRPTNSEDFNRSFDEPSLAAAAPSQPNAVDRSEPTDIPRYSIAPAPATPAGVSQFVSEPERVDILEENVRSLPLVESQTVELSGSEGLDRKVVQRQAAENADRRQMTFNSLPPTHGNSMQPAAVAAPAEPAVDPDAHLVVSREEMARQISRKNLLGDYAQSRGAVPVAVESPIGWQAVEKELRQRLDACDRLLRRGAPLSAREEAFRGVRTLTRSLDARRGTYVCEPSFEQAIIALQEATDFYDSLTHSTSNAKTADIVQTHETPVLQNADLRGVSPEIAAQHYRAYARDMLVRATQSHPWGADMFFAIGKSYETQSNQDASIRRVNMENASVFYHAAVRTNPRQGDAANQLGYALLHLDRTGEAQKALAHAYQTQPNADVVRNLAELYRRTGNEAQLGWTSQQLAILDPPSEKKAAPQVDLMTPQQFAAISPRIQSVTPNGDVVAASSSNPSPVATPASADPKDESGNIATSWFKKIFK